MQLNNNKGFTLIELIAVIVIISVSLLVVFPRIPSFDVTDVKKSARTITNVVTTLDDLSIRRKEIFKLVFLDNSIEVYYFSQDIENNEGKENNSFDEKDKDVFTLERGVSIEKIIIEGVEIDRSREEAFVIFSSTSGANPFLLTLGEEDEQLNVIYNPFNGQVRIEEIFDEI